MSRTSWSAISRPTCASWRSCTQPAELAQLVASREPCDQREVESRQLFLSALKLLARPFDRDADRWHVTASAIVVGPRGVALHRHRRLGLWLQPGGHVDAGEEPADAALRESIEETGLACAFGTQFGRSLAHLDVHQAYAGHVHLDLRYVVEADGDPAPPDGESQDVAWFGWDEAIAMADAGLVGALREVRARLTAG